MSGYTHEVVRPIRGMDLNTGDLVDASGWRTATKMEDQRYLRRLPDESVVQLRSRVAELEQENKRLLKRLEKR